MVRRECNLPTARSTPSLCCMGRAALLRARPPTAHQMWSRARAVGRRRGRCTRNGSPSIRPRPTFAAIPRAPQTNARAHTHAARRALALHPIVVRTLHACSPIHASHARACPSQSPHRSLHILFGETQGTQTVCSHAKPGSLARAARLVLLAIRRLRHLAWAAAWRADTFRRRASSRPSCPRRCPAWCAGWRPRS